MTRYSPRSTRRARIGPIRLIRDIRGENGEATIAYLFILAMILLTVYGQMVFKWQAMGLGAFPAGWAERGLFLLRILFNPWIVSSYAAALLASLFWLGR